MKKIKNLLQGRNPRGFSPEDFLFFSLESVYIKKMLYICSVKQKSYGTRVLIKKNKDMQKIELKIGFKEGKIEKKTINVSSIEDAIQECRWIITMCQKAIVVSFAGFGSNYIIERG